jgi:hypothetical protein
MNKTKLSATLGLPTLANGRKNSTGSVTMSYITPAATNKAQHHDKFAISQSCKNYPKSQLNITDGKWRDV